MLLLKLLQRLPITDRMESRFLCVTEEVLPHLVSTIFSAFLLYFSLTNSMLSPKTAQLTGVFSSSLELLSVFMGTTPCCLGFSNPLLRPS